MAPLTPGYDAVRDIVSLLGTSGAPYATWFNAGIAASGLAGLAGAAAFALSTRGWATALFALSLAGVSLGNLWAARFPLPDPRHVANPFLPAFFLLPALLAALAWRDGRLRRALPAFLVNALAFAALLALRALLPAACAGAVQRLHALTVYLPPAVAALMLMRAAPPPPALRA